MWGRRTRQPTMLDKARDFDKARPISICSARQGQQNPLARHHVFLGKARAVEERRTCPLTGLEMLGKARQQIRSQAQTYFPGLSVHTSVTSVPPIRDHDRQLPHCSLLQPLASHALLPDQRSRTCPSLLHAHWFYIRRRRGDVVHVMARRTVCTAVGGAAGWKKTLLVATESRKYISKRQDWKWDCMLFSS